MFSTTPASHPSVKSLRNPRRRQRANSDESTQPPKAKRQRSNLVQDTEETVGLTAHNHEHDLHAETPKLDLTDGSRRSPPKHALPSHDLALRGPRKREKRGDYSDGSITLSSNDYYTVSHLPAFPDIAKGNETVSFRYIISPEDGYCLALSRQEVIIWPYRTFSAGTAAEMSFRLSLPSTAKNSTDPLPLASLISKSSDRNPGLVVVIPSTGKVILFETVSNSSILGLVKPKQNYIQGAIPTMLSGEEVTQLVNAEPSGILAILSTGRLAHISIRDSQGKPVVSAQLLQGSPGGGTSTGLFGGIRNALSSSSWRRRVTAAKAAESFQRGQRDIIMATNSGCFEIWDTHWNNCTSLRAQVNAKSSILEALERKTALASDDIEGSFQLLDFAFVPLETDDLPESSEHYKPRTFWALITVSQQSQPLYFVVELSIDTSTATAGSVYSVSIQKPSTVSSPRFVPRLYVPKPWKSAFIVFGEAVVLLSLAPSTDSPSAQLYADNNSIPLSFQDCISFREGKGFSTLASGAEDDQRHVSCLIMVENSGLLRVSALPRRTSEDGIEDAVISAKSRLEQAVFYGGMKNNPIDFTSHSELFTSPDLEDAALQISDEVLRSSSKYIQPTTPSLEQLLRTRAAALHDLVTYLNRHDVRLSRLARWKLLWDAEKLAAQRALWRVHEQAKGPDARQTQLERVIGKMGDKFKTKSDPEYGERDQIRHWFLYDTWQMEHVIPWISNSLRDRDVDPPKVDRQFAQQLAESIELSLATLKTAFQFRDDNAALYLLADEYNEAPAKHSAQYTDLPEFWTSTQISCDETENLLDLELNACVQWMRQATSESEPSVDPNIEENIASIERNLPGHVKLLSRVLRERAAWHEAQADGAHRDGGKALRKSSQERGRTRLFKMAAVGLLEEAISLAENFRDMDALVELMVELHDQMNQRRDLQRLPGQEKAVLTEEKVEWRRRIDKYFEKFGESWADAFLTRHILVGQPEKLLVMREYQPYVTRFLRKRPEYAKLSWINDVVGETDYDTSSQTLKSLAKEQESDLWCKRVQLSLGKLAKLAGHESSGEDLSALQPELEEFDGLARLCTIQEVVYDHMLPALHGAIDEGAELQLAVEQFACNVVRDKPALTETLHRGLAKLVARSPVNPNELIDILTLMDPVQFLEGDEDELVGREFTTALEVLKLSDYASRDPEYYQALEQLIWRRCMIRDGWVNLNEIDRKADRDIERVICETALYETLRQYFEELGDVAVVSAPYAPLDVTTCDVLTNRLEHLLPPEQYVSTCEDLNTEVAVLREYVESGKLGKWFSWVVDMAKAGAMVSGPDNTGLDNM